MPDTFNITEDAPPTDARHLVPYESYAEQANALVAAARAITVKDENDYPGMQAARRARLSLKEVRIAITNRHKELKADILKRGNELDRGKRALLSIIEPLEEDLQRLENTREIVERNRKQFLAETRREQIANYTLNPEAFNLGEMTEEAFAELHASLKAGAEARLAAAQAAKLAAEAKAKEDAEVAARIRAENEALRAAAEKERAAREAAEKVIRDQQAAVAAELDARAAEERAAAAAPDREKLRAFANALALLPIPTLTTQAGKEAERLLREQVKKFSAWVNGKADAL